MRIAEKEREMLIFDTDTKLFFFFFFYPTTEITGQAKGKINVHAPVTKGLRHSDKGGVRVQTPAYF